MRCALREGALLKEPKPPRVAPSCFGARGGGADDRCDENPPLNDFDDDEDWRGSAVETVLKLSSDNTSTAWRACIKVFMVMVIL